MDYRALIVRLKAMKNPANVEGMARFGISSKNTLGISMPEIRKFAKEIGKDHSLALRLWDSGIHEARILAALIADPQKVTPSMMNRWVKDFDSWDICDQCCCNLFDKTPYAYSKVEQWSNRKQEFVKRAAFALMAGLAVHDKKAPDDRFVEFLSIIERSSNDPRNFVKKAVNWALRQIGKRNLTLCDEALRTAKKISKQDSASARWIAADAIRELEAKREGLRSRI
ncbi:MAG TPA: DNA alkylation repair protein [Acidobacteriota bacterium]|nr:DNA alkylation repair protein [Acidobacteriota bacterium]